MRRMKEGEYFVLGTVSRKKKIALNNWGTGRKEGRGGKTHYGGGRKYLSLIVYRRCPPNTGEGWKNEGEKKGVIVPRLILEGSELILDWKKREGKA